jgi:hypothetical protein
VDRSPAPCLSSTKSLFSVDDNAVDIVEQIADQRSAITAIDIHLDNLATGFCIAGCKVSGIHAVVSEFGSIDSPDPARHKLDLDHNQLVFHHSSLGNLGSATE